MGDSQMARVETGPGGDLNDAARSDLTFGPESRNDGQLSGDVSFEERAT
jgi:hypothetical protein